MGMSLFKNCSLYPPSEKIFAPNPNPANFQIIRVQQIGNHVVAEIHYPDCKNFEGLKICLFKNIKKSELDGDSLDPHFHEGSKSPYARFQPTLFGWESAIALAKMEG